MRRLKSVENDQVQLEVIECDCGYHMGIDATFLDQIGDVFLICPACNKIFRTDEICPEGGLCDDIGECSVDSDGCLIDNDGDAETDIERIMKKKCF